MTLNTILPFADFAWSARCLTNDILNNQRFHTLKIMRALLLSETYEDHPTVLNHPAVLMWYGHTKALLAYQQAICNEWVNQRGQEDTAWDQTRLLFLDETKSPILTPMILPPWLNNPDFHISHQSNLLRQNEEHYRPWFPGIKNDHPYLWPVL